MPLSVPLGGIATGEEAWELPSTLPSGARTFLPPVLPSKDEAAATQYTYLLQLDCSTPILLGSRKRLRRITGGVCWNEISFSNPGHSRV